MLPSIRALFAASLVLAIQGFGFSSSSITPAEALIEQRVAERVLPGAVLLVVRDGQVQTLRAFGYADVENGRPMRTDTLFRLASAAKIVTTAGLLSLVDEGRVDLDRPVATYLPEFSSPTVFTDAGARPATRPSSRTTRGPPASRFSGTSRCATAASKSTSRAVADRMRRRMIADSSASPSAWRRMPRNTR